MDECEESELPPPPAASSLGPTPRQSALGPEAARWFLPASESRMQMHNKNQTLALI